MVLLRRSDILSPASRIILSGCRFLDDVKIGLTPVSEVLIAPAILDLSSPHGALGFDKVNLWDNILHPGRLYLAHTEERISLPKNVIGLLHTRSTYARFGLDCLRSSAFVSPGFGADRPMPLVLEITVTTVVQGLQRDALASLILFGVGDDISDCGPGRHSGRFPLSLLDS